MSQLQVAARVEVSLIELISRDSGSMTIGEGIRAAPKDVRQIDELTRPKLVL